MIFVSGCATTSPSVSVETIETKEKGVYHKVQKGETLWQIAKAYQIPIQDIIKKNHIPNIALIEENQLVFIPGQNDKKVISSADSISSDNDKFEWPVKGRIIHYFGQQRGPSLFKGIGILAQKEQYVFASRPGKVVFADYLVGYSYTVILDHLDGYLSIYAQNSQLTVRKGDIVQKGERISQLGDRGLSYLYFEIRKNAIPDNPLYYLPKL